MATDPNADPRGAAGPLFDASVFEEEGLFARDIDGQLVRLVDATAGDYQADVRLTVDGHEVTVNRAAPQRDAQGDIVNDREGRTIPRRTTIYDAASEVFVKKPGDANPIPVLCHREHMTPAGVCRVCVVEVYRTVDGKRRGGGKMVPACHHQVEDGMEVHTIESPDEAARERVQNAVRVLTELLVADHLPGDHATGDTPNELADLAARLGVDASRFAPRTLDRGADESSPQIAVDHNSCILCDRCVRACSEVKENYVIGRTGKGYEARIGFDLDQPMGESSCVSCGECMISCPTDALTFRKAIAREEAPQPGESPVTAAELKEIPLFAGVPYKFLQWNSGAVTRQRLAKGEVLCREGEYGREAFLLLDGEFEVTNASKRGRESKQADGNAWGWFGRVRNRLVASDAKDAAAMRSSGSHYAWDGPIRLDKNDLIIGEMTCMSHYPRSTTVTAATDAEVLRINRNVLYMLQRDPTARAVLNDVYRERALDNQLESIALLEALDPALRKECVDYLHEVAELTRVDPGQVIFKQGERARDFYIIRLGFVKVSQDHGGQELVLSYLGPGNHFGEIGIVSTLTDELEGRLPAAQAGGRVASCTALDTVELVVIRGEHFREMWRRFPGLRGSLVDYATKLLSDNARMIEDVATPLPEFLDQGLFNAQKLLVLDLEACTRCDECTKACADTHGGVTRLIRDGMRFDKWLVASSCRSCMDPYCLVGCPVDAIHREGSMEIRIDDHCIGCGLCANNCPYGNINMHGFEQADDTPGRTAKVIQQKATTCDLCRDIVGPDDDPSCVYACPHNAAFRMSGRGLLDRVTR